MNSEISTPSQSSTSGFGRELLFNYYRKNGNLNGKNGLNNLIGKIKSDLNWFNKTSKGILEDGMPFAYNYNSHKFVSSADTALTFDPLLAKRDFLAEKIKGFAKNLLKYEQGYKHTDIAALEAYLNHKLTHNTFSSIQEFIDKASKEETVEAEDNLDKLFGKLEKGVYLSVEEKEKKLAEKEKAKLQTPAQEEEPSSQEIASQINNPVNQVLELDTQGMMDHYTSYEKMFFSEAFYAKIQDSQKTCEADTSLASGIDLPTKDTVEVSENMKTTAKKLIEQTADTPHQKTVQVEKKPNDVPAEVVQPGPRSVSSWKLFLKEVNLFFTNIMNWLSSLWKKLFS